MVPMLALGIPGSGTTAVMLGALSIFDVQPGPFLFTKSPDLVWGLIASMYIGNVMLLVLNVLFVPAFVVVMRVLVQILAPLVVIFSVLGVYSLNYSVFDLWLMFGAGVIGYFMNKLDYPAAPLVLALVLGARMEKTLRQSLQMSLGDVSIFFTRPICFVIMVAVIVIILWPPLNKFVVKPLLRHYTSKVAT
jgi:putative tricarboxylic transport membrane protein